MTTTWDDKSVGWYRKKERYHSKLWEHVHATIRRCNVKSILEIGGGPGRLSTTAEKYVGVDIARPVVEAGQKRYRNSSFICADWLKLSTAPFDGQFDMALALAVIEHSENHDLFLEKLCAVRPRVVIVSYFRNLTDQRPARRPRQDPNGIWFWEHRHSLSHVRSLLNQWGLDGMYSIEHVRYGRKVNLIDAILTIEPTEQWRAIPWRDRVV